MATERESTLIGIWTFRADLPLAGVDLAGYEVEASDGTIGKIDEATYEAGGSYIVVDTGPWIFGKKVLLPAGTVHHIDHQEKRLYVDRTKQQIKDSPEFDPESFRGEAYRDKIGGYYSDTYPMGEVAPPTPAGTVPPAAAPTPGGMVPPAAAPPLRADTEGSGPEREGDFPR